MDTCKPKDLDPDQLTPDEVEEVRKAVDLVERLAEVSPYFVEDTTGDSRCFWCYGEYRNATFYHRKNCPHQEARRFLVAIGRLDHSEPGALAKVID